MRILKRDKSSQAFTPNKILNRIKTQAKGLKVDSDTLFQEVIPLISDNITTTEIDEIIAFKAADKVILHPDYSLLGGRILLSRQSKLIGKELQPVDLTYDFFAATTFLTKYSLKDSNKVPVELPSCMYNRVAEFLHDNNEDDKLELLEEITNKRGNFATPTYTNTGVPERNGMISCFTKDTLVSTDKGLVEISKIKEGDLVLTHNNRFKRVNEVYVNPLLDRTVKLVKVYRTKEIKCTDNHEFLSYTSEDERLGLEPSFKPIKWLRVGDYVKSSYVDNFIGDDSTVIKQLGNDFFYRINDIQTIEIDDEFVYDLNVDEDHSYSVENIVVHNCNLTHLEDDSFDGIENTLTKISAASKEGSGIGLLIDPLRSKDSIVESFKGNAGGVVRLADMVQSKMRFYKQGSRSGSCALYLSVWHRDILDFLELTLPIGDEQLRTRDLFTAVVINDLFMKKLQNNESWYTFCPNDIKKSGLRALYDLHGEEFEIEYQKAVDLGLGKKVDPKSIFDSIIKSQVESGKPYVMFKDNANKNNMQRNIGVIKQSNLCCLDGESIITIINENGGIEKITMEEIVDKFKNNNNLQVLSQDNTFQPILGAIKTKENAEVLEIIDEEKGIKLICTPDHRIFTKNRGYVMACDLLEDDELDVNFN